MGKNKKASLKIIVLLGVAVVLLIALGLEKYFLKNFIPQTSKADDPIADARPIVVLPPSAQKKEIFLDKSLNWEIAFGDLYTRSFLARELVRQALLLSAREEAGLSVHDAWLGDAIPDDKADETLDVTARMGHPNKMLIEIGRKPERKKIAEWDIETSPELTYKLLLEQTEELSRGKFLTALKNGGYIPQSKKAQSEEKVPPEIEKLLGEMNYISQYSAVRQLHALIRSKGESAELQGALVRGYANLGLLTEYNWHPSFKVFFARSMLYAQRMVAEGKHPGWAKWHRAYAFALSGLQQRAMEDIADADKSRQVSSGEKKDNFAKPAWVDVIDAYCRYDTKALVPDGDHPGNSELTGFLQTVANELAMNGDLIVTNALEMLDKSPECYRLYHVVCRYGGVSVGHPGTTVCFQVFRDKSYQRLAKIPGMPEDVAKIIKKMTSGGGLLSKLFGVRNNSEENEYLVRRELVASLLNTGNTAKIEQTTEKQPATLEKSSINQNSGIADAGEPSWATLGLLIREMSFAQVWRRIYFESKSLAVEPEFTMEQLKPLYADHPYGEYLNIYSWNKDVKNKAVEKVQSICVDEAILQSYPLVEEVRRSSRELGNNLLLGIFSQMDHTSNDLTRGLGVKLRRERKNRGYIKEWASCINRISPWSPFMGSLLIDYDWDSVSNDFHKWENIAASHPDLMRTIARRYDKDNKVDDAIRCLKTAISVSPDQYSFELLANMYYKTGDKKKYFTTMEEFLKYPDYHLSHGVFSRKIAYRYMADRKWLKALPYAQRAAETYSCWGLICLANCCEALKGWNEAEQLQKASSERYYRSSPFNWYFFCRRTGKGDLEAARKFVLEHIEDVQSCDEFDVCLFYMLEGNQEKAFELLEKYYNKYPSVSFGLLCAFTAEQFKDTSKRDTILKLIIDKDAQLAEKDKNDDYNEFIQLAKMIIEDFAKQQSELDVDAALKLRLHHKGEVEIYFNYCLGKYLELRGRTKESIDLMKKSFTEWYYISHGLRTLAGVNLREHGLSQEEIESILPTENTEEEKESTPADANTLEVNEETGAMFQQPSGIIDPGNQ